MCENSEEESAIAREGFVGVFWGLCFGPALTLIDEGKRKAGTWASRTVL